MALLMAVLSLAAGYTAGRTRPWRSLGDWAVDQLRFGDAARGGRLRQAAVLLAHALTRPVTTVAILRTPRAPEPAPAFKSQWTAGQAGEQKTGDET